VVSCKIDRGARGKTELMPANFQVNISCGAWRAQRERPRVCVGGWVTCIGYRSLSARRELLSAAGMKRGARIFTRRALKIRSFTHFSSRAPPNNKVESGE
jgi:hypothetical protein